MKTAKLSRSFHPTHVSKNSSCQSLMTLFIIAIKLLFRPIDSFSALSDNDERHKKEIQNYNFPVVHFIVACDPISLFSPQRNVQM